MMQCLFIQREVVGQTHNDVIDVAGAGGAMSSPAVAACPVLFAAGSRQDGAKSAG